MCYYNERIISKLQTRPKEKWRKNGTEKSTDFFRQHL